MAAPVLHVTPDDFQQEVFGSTGFFPFCSREGQWCIFHRGASCPRATLFHGTTLFQLWQILESKVWLPGLWLGRPEGIWLATTPSAAIDRASAKRGYALSQDPPGIPNGWDKPVAIGFDYEVSQSVHKRTLKNDVELRVWSVDGRTRVPLVELPIVSLHIDKPHYDRMQELSYHWPALESGESVLCGSHIGEPDFFKSGHGNGWTCCRVTAYPKICGWIKTQSGYRCPDCDWNERFLRGSVTGER